MLHPEQEPEPKAEKAAFRRLKEWARLHDTIILSTPSNRYYVLLTLPDGEAPILQFIGTGVLAAHANLIGRGRATYADTFSNAPRDLAK